MILHKAYQGKKTSASLDDELFDYVVAYFDGDPQRAREALGRVLEEGIEQQLPLSAHLRQTVLHWIVKTEVVERRERILNQNELDSIAQLVRDRLPEHRWPTKTDSEDPVHSAESEPDRMPVARHQPEPEFDVDASLAWLMGKALPQ